MPKDDSENRLNDGERLLRLRREMRRSQMSWAGELGCDVRTIRNREKGKTEISQADRRKLGELSGVDVIPLNKEEHPKLIVERYREYNIKQTLVGRFWRFRSRNILRNQLDLTPLRRAYENIVSFAYLLATTTFAMEQFQRAIGGWEQHQAYHDALFVGSAAMVVMLILPSIQTIAWGYVDRRMIEHRARCDAHVNCET